MPYSTFHVPGIDAGVSLALDGNRLAICLMAKGRARAKDGSYSKRNPDRRALLLHLLEHISNLDGEEITLTHSKAGESAAPWVQHDTASVSDMRQVYSKAGNFRVDYQFRYHGPDCMERLAFDLLRLEPADNRRPPRDVRFYTEP